MKKTIYVLAAISVGIFLGNRFFPSKDLFREDLTENHVEKSQELSGPVAPSAGSEHQQAKLVEVAGSRDVGRGISSSEKEAGKNPVVEPVEIDQYQAYLDDLSTKALPSKQDLVKLSRLVNSSDFQKVVFDVIEAKGVSTFSFKEEKQRFKHQSYLYEMFLYGDEDTRRTLQERLERQILSEEFMKFEDVKLKQSLAGDKIDYLRFMKKRFPTDFARLEERILESGSKILKFCLSRV